MQRNPPDEIKTLRVIDYDHVPLKVRPYTRANRREPFAPIYV